MSLTTLARPFLAPRAALTKHPQDNIAASIGEEAGTIEDVIEPYLIQQGFLQRTPRGRIATLAAYRHLGVAPPRTDGSLFEA